MKWFKDNILDHDDIGRTVSYSGTLTCHPKGFRGIPVLDKRGLPDRPAIFTRKINDLDNPEYDRWVVYAYPLDDSLPAEGVYTGYTDLTSDRKGEFLEVIEGEVLNDAHDPGTLKPCSSYVYVENGMMDDFDDDGAGNGNKGFLHPIDLHMWTVDPVDAGANYTIYKDAITGITPTPDTTSYDVSGDCTVDTLLTDICFNPNDLLIYVLAEDPTAGTVKVGYLDPVVPSITWMISLSVSDYDTASDFYGGATFNWKGDLFFSTNHVDPMAGTVSCDLYFVSSANVQAGGPYDPSGDKITTVNNMHVFVWTCDTSSNSVYYASHVAADYEGKVYTYQESGLSYDWTADVAFDPGATYAIMTLCSATDGDVTNFMDKIDEYGS